MAKRSNEASGTNYLTRVLTDWESTGSKVGSKTLCGRPAQQVSCQPAEEGVVASTCKRCAKEMLS